MASKTKYTFSGHESFICKSLWLKKGYDFVANNGDFNDDRAVVDLGVGKNMVSSIRFWMKAFGMLDNNNLSSLAKSILGDNGYDPYLEDLGTAWLLHYLLVKSEVASIYPLLFKYFKKERNSEFTRDQLQAFVKRICDESGNSQQYNENTVKRDIGVLIQNYVTPIHPKTNEDFSALLMCLNLIKQMDEKKENNTFYYFNYTAKSAVVKDIFLYAVIDSNTEDKAVSFDSLMDLASIFCMTKTELIDLLIDLSKTYPKQIQYSDNSGIRQLLFLEEMNKDVVLHNYYMKS